MLFDLHPKENKKELFGRNEEYKELERLVRSEWVIVLGRRMVGKTSLVKTFVKEHDGVYVNLSGVREFKDLILSIASQSGYALKDLGLDLKLLQFKWSRLGEDVFSRLKNKIIVLDEVQYVSSIHFLRLLKRIWDTYPNLRIIFTGSMVGLINKLLNPSPSSPLYGRKPAILNLKPFGEKESMDFLIRGFSEFNINVDLEEVERVVKNLNGYPGWLAYYGNFRCVRKLDIDISLKSVIDEGVKIFREELNNFLKGKRREAYIRILRILSIGARWSELKSELMVNSKILWDMLRSLRSAMLISEDNGYYYIPDPILRIVIKNIKL
ncbi:MAG: ATP-binding protein [Candidatus Methanomethylicia archaeon]